MAPGPDVTDDANVAAASELDVRSPDGRMTVRRFPHVIGLAFRLVWRAARREMLTCFGLQLFGGVGITLQLLLGRTVISAVVGSGPQRRLLDLAPQLLGLAVVTALLGFAAAAVREREQVLRELVELHVQGQIIDVVSALDLEVFESPAFHDHLQRAKVNAVSRSWQVSFGLVSLASGVMSVVALAVVLVSIQALVLPLVLMAYLPLWLATSRNGRAAYDFAYWMTAADRERLYLQGALTGTGEAKEIRLFGLSGYLRGRYDDAYAKRIIELRRVVSRRLRRSLVANAGATLVTLVGVGALIELALTRRISPADAGVAAVAVQQLGARLRGLDNGIAALHESSLFLEDLVSFLDLRATTAESRPTGRAPAGFSRLTVEEVHFRYPGVARPVLHAVNMEIRAGEIVALVGRNGSGKTTLAKVLCGLYGPSSGRVCWDGVDVAGCDPAEVRSKVTAIFQDFVHYELPARDNVGLGDAGRIDDLGGIHQAARLAGADGALASLPAGYDTRLSRAFEGGAELSIGQWQRVALARAFFRDAPFLVLDEPTAALDPESEHELFESIRSLQRGRAVLLISHRFSSVRSADRIYVLEHGVIVEVGSHEELLRRRGRYADLFNRQASAYLDGREPADGG